MSTPFEPIQPATLLWQNDVPYFPLYDECYDAPEHLRAEQQRVFIDGNRLKSRWASLTPGQTFIIADIGFGAGLNCLLACALWHSHAPSDAHLHILSCDKHPLNREDLIRCTAMWPSLANEARILIENYPILTPGIHQLTLAPNITLTLMLGDAFDCYQELLCCGDASLERSLRSWCVDAWFLAGGRLGKKPTKWSERLFTLIRLLSKPMTTATSCSMASWVSEGLSSAGFDVINRSEVDDDQGMLFASFSEKRNAPVNPILRRTPWAVPHPQASSKQKAIVIGAGLAGCFVAHELARRGWEVTLLDDQHAPGQGASGNRHAILSPKLSLYRSPLTVLMLSSFLHAIKVYKPLLEDGVCGELRGIFQLPYRPSEKKIQQSLVSWFKSYPELGQLLNETEASACLGLKVSSGGLLIPRAGWIDSEALCQRLVERTTMHWQPNVKVQHLVREGEEWNVEGFRAPVVVIANGYRADQFAETSYCKLKAIHGQMTMIAATPQSKRLLIPLCGDAHVVPARDGVHGLGATYNPSVTTTDCCDQDDKINLTKLVALPADAAWSLEASAHWANVRGAASDYLPIVGPVARHDAFMYDYAGLATNSKRWIPRPCPVHPGLYLFAGFGSRGLTTVPLCADVLASMIHGEPHGFSHKLVQAVSPARFLFKQLIQSMKR